MKVQPFCEYSTSEQRNLLMHWWYYFCSGPCGFEYTLKFKKLIDKDPQLAMNMVFLAALDGKGNDTILSMMHKGKFEEYCDEVAEFSLSDDFLKMYETGERYLIDEIVDSARNPGAKRAEVKSEILSGVKGLICSGGYELNSDRVYELYERCAMNEEDFCNGELQEDFVVAEGIDSCTFFVKDRLEENKKEIFECIKMLPGLNRGNSCSNLFRDKNDVCWTNKQDVLDRLLQLGIATEMIYFPLPRNVWHNLPMGLPIVAATYDLEDMPELVHKPCDYPKVLEKLSENNLKKDE